MKINALNSVVGGLLAVAAAGNARAAEPVCQLSTQTSQCQDARGRACLNPGLVGECGDLRNAHLEGADLRDLNLDGANLEGAHLAGAKLDGAYLNHAHLRGADLKGASLVGASLRNASFERADLEKADLSQTLLFKATLRDSNLRGVKLARTLAGLRLDTNDFQGAVVDSTSELALSLDKGAAKLVTVEVPHDAHAPLLAGQDAAAVAR